MTPPTRVLVIQTAFPGDVVLTLPLLQQLREVASDTFLALMTIPSAASLAEHHPAVDQVVVYDKRGEDNGLRGLARMAASLRRLRFDTALIPHRSLRSAIVARAAGIPRRIGFSTSAGRLLLTDVVKYRHELHEIARNLSLLGPVGIRTAKLILPTLHPSSGERSVVDALLAEHGLAGTSGDPRRMVGLAPGSVWFTKRWPEESYGALCRSLHEEGMTVVLVGGGDDVPLCERVARAGGSPGVVNAAGRLSLLQSAELIRRCRLIVTNDSAPMHLAGAVGTPVIALFGATVPAFGFAPLGPNDQVLETHGLHCRPCAIHGGPSCPVGTLECLRRITEADVLQAVRKVLL